MGGTRALLCAGACWLTLALPGPTLAACSSGVPVPDPSTTMGTTTATIDVLLETHCGVRYLVVDGDWFERDGGPLDDGRGNPPPGWGNPYHAGRVVLSDDTALFSDDVGHHETFRRLPTAPTIDCT
jgi:hypothetical protein